ncbi:5-carboxymethyl-2-hydroxymuconate Delta-isomerase [Novosphingobium beihaiensis]|uniref:5-carboxymethyl-2-hydroxymuconate Delta-isomerase n=1 Tax=Novosphingobium beihaiensis TaxID=2930389 RepID=A0ABT0BLD6_9SPHN|nr:5-carboxymethyl-2-hydroxymuconate Delta-isomerase [Novosphingobium beihaiensis]MCJ2185857.1 5-carboxymethyl-2-hydroxymuconate Delta-isomerase [Novosphingobium beihaiensis]
MAHVTIEWTANLEGEFDLRALMELVAEDMRERADGVFPVGGIRVRAYRADEYVIADNAGPDDAFVNLDVKMGAGRSAEFRQRYFDALFERVSAFFGDLFERRPLALSMYVEEASGWKKNSIHQRLKKAL